MKDRLSGFSLCFDLAAPLICYMIVNDLVLYFSQIFFGEMGDAQVLPASGIGAAMSCIFLCNWYLKKRQLYGSAEQRGRWTAKDVCLIVIMAAGACVFINNLLAVLELQDSGFERVKERLNTPSMTVQIICTVLVIPLAEELIFRGLAYTRLREEMPKRRAAIVSAVYFGIFHGNLVQGIYAVILGCLLAFVFECYGRLRASWLFHAAANFTAVLMTRLGVYQLLKENRVWMTAVTAVSAALCIAAAYMIREEKRK